MDVNATKEKKLTNIRTHSHDDALRLVPPPPMTLETAIEFIAADELVEVTPRAIRMRKRLLSQHDRRRERGREEDRRRATRRRQPRPRPDGLVGRGRRQERAYNRGEHLPDHAASSPLRPEVLEQMLPILSGDGASRRRRTSGLRARQALDKAHERLALSLGESPSLVFTSGGMEAINLAVKGAAWAGKAAGHRIVTGRRAQGRAGILPVLEKYGFDVRKLPVDRYGRPDLTTSAPHSPTDHPREPAAATTRSAASRPWRNSSPRTRWLSALVHVDAVQAAAQLPIDVGALGADLVSLAAHKVEGPRGVGALWIRRGTAILPQIHGGSHERYRRAGTEDVAGAVGMAAAFELAAAERAVVVPVLAERRDRLRRALLAVDDVESTGHPVERLPGSLSVIVRGVAGDDLVGAGPGASPARRFACATSKASMSARWATAAQANWARASPRSHHRRRGCGPCSVCCGHRRLREAARLVPTSRGASGGMTRERVLVAMSAVDSSAAAALVGSSDVVGVWMRLMMRAPAATDRAARSTPPRTPDTLPDSWASRSTS
jgi:cysteine desulfurase